jgi:hypothetical protein
MTISDQGKIITLWAVFLLGTVFHAQLGLMPLFHGKSIVEIGANPAADIDWIMWLMLGFFTLPMFAMVATSLTEIQPYRKAHFYLTAFYTIMNFLHIVFDLMVTPIFWYQIALMVILFANGILLNVVSYQWMQKHVKIQDPPVSTLLGEAFPQGRGD